MHFKFAPGMKLCGRTVRSMVQFCFLCGKETRVRGGR